jgi:uncharacterized protein (DUF305 family)
VPTLPLAAGTRAQYIYQLPSYRLDASNTPMISRSALMALVVSVAMSACARSAREQAPILQPGAPGESTRTIPAGEVDSLAHPRFTAGDIAFMQGMIGHHAQALEMVALLQTRTESGDMKNLAQRIAVSQADEIQMMREWLEDRGAEAPGEHAHHAHDAKLMPGMLTPEQMQRLSELTGPAFDKLFLESMIKHHEGALIMVRELFATPGAGQDAEIYAFASDVDADQRMEIIRMAGMLKELQK